MNHPTQDRLIPATPEHTWLGLPTVRIEGLPKILAQLPRFERRPFSVTTGLAALTADNPNFDAIVRLPVTPQESEVPVGVVSKSYTLIQHRQVLDLAFDALKANGIDGDCEARLVMTTLGERADLSVTFPPEYQFDPGDGHPLGLQVRCINSVDGSTRFTLVIGWLRFVCSNGLIVGTTTTRIRQIHNGSLDPNEISYAVQAGLQLAIEDRKKFARWVATPVTEARLRKWVDTRVRKAWGVKAAARAQHIMLTGWDGRIKPFETGLPSERTIERERPVPGAGGGLNAYSASQALAWLARGRRDHQERLEWTMKIPELMQNLLR